jgi:ATP-dependent RNA helicase DHX29
MPAKVQDTSELKAPRTPRGPTAEGKGVPSTHAVKPNRNRSQTNDDNDQTRQTQRPSASPLDASAPSFVPRTAIMDATLRSGSAGSETPMTMSSLNSERASPDSDDPHAEYVRLKIEIDSMTTHRTAQEDREASHLILLKRRLASVQDHYFFRQDEADELYKTARQDLDAKTLQARLRGEAPALSSKKKRPTRLAEPSPPSADSEDSDEPGGMLDILETLQESVVDGKTVPVRDMGTSKQWSGRTPKVLLSETVRKVDRRAVISYRNISGNSRAQRMSVDVRADGGKEGTWTMDDVACTTEAQVCQPIV